MRIPKDITLATYIRRLIDNHKVEEFYWTEDWRELKEYVKDFYHNECQECLKEGIYTKAECVHHVNEVRARPDLALSMYYIDGEGNQQINLMPLCNACHNKQHPEKNKSRGQKEHFSNKELW